MTDRRDTPPGDRDRRGGTSRPVPFRRIGAPMRRAVLASVRSLASNSAAPAGAQQPRCRDWNPDWTAARRPRDAGAPVHRGLTEMATIVAMHPRPGGWRRPLLPKRECQPQLRARVATADGAAGSGA